MKQLLLSLFLLFTSLLLSQSKVDSLQLELGKELVDSAKIKILHELYDMYIDESPNKAEQVIIQATKLSEKEKNVRLLSASYYRFGDLLRSRSEYDSAITFYQKALEKSNKIAFKLGITSALYGLGYSYWRKADAIKALEYQDRHMKIAIEMGDVGIIADSNKLLASIYAETGEYVLAMQSYITAAKGYQQLGNLKDWASTLSNIGLVQRRLQNYESAKNYLLQSDSLYKKINNTLGRAHVQYNLAVIYKNLGELDKAFFLNEKAMKTYDSLGNKERTAHTLYTMGEIYRKKIDFNNALIFYQKSMEVSKGLGDSINYGYSVIALGDCYYELGENGQATLYFLKAVETANALKQDLMAMEAYESLSKIYEIEGNFKEAYKAKSRYAIVRDSFYTSEKRGLAAEIEAKYQNEQKVKEIELLSTEKNLQTLQLQKRINERNGIIVFSLILLLLAALLYNQFRIKRTANKKLLELDRLKSNFFANISHEFRTPLTLIKGPIEQMEQNPDEPLSMENIKMIRRNTNRVLKMVNQLLDLSKVDEGNLKLESTEGDVYKCLRAAAASFNSHAAQRNIDYRVQVPQTSLWANFDRDKLENIVYNLLGNAFKFSEDGSTIVFEVDYEERGLFVQVSDSGKGIPKENLPFIFDRFYQVDGGNSREKEGTGIGLSLSKDLVELMDGTITVTSEVGKGTFFTLLLPLQEIKTGADEVPRVDKIVKSTILKDPYPLSKADKREVPKILLVEDNKDMRHFIRELLIKHYKLEEAVNGNAGLKMAITNPPDLIITDLMMPKMDGISLCKKLKNNVHTSHVPIIMLTAKAGQENKIEGLETGADDYLTKPFDGKELLVRTKNLIEQRQRLRELYTNKEVQVDPKKVTVTSIDQKFLEQVLELLEANFSDPDFGVPEMQQSLAMSKTQLHRKLKALTNEPPGELLRNFRLKRAAQLLSQKANSVTQIAYEVGFNNLSYFAKCFKELFGVSPSSY